MTAALFPWVALIVAVIVWWRTMEALRNWVLRFLQAQAHIAIAIALAGDVEPERIPEHLRSPE